MQYTSALFSLAVWGVAQDAPGALACECGDCDSRHTLARSAHRSIPDIAKCDRLVRLRELAPSLAGRSRMRGRVPQAARPWCVPQPSTPPTP
jgi:hypothetical protein